MKKKTKNNEWEQVMNVFEWNPVKGAEIVVSLLNSKDDMVKLEAAIFILNRVLGKPRMMQSGGRKNST